MAVRELPFVNLMNALALVVVYARNDGPKFERAAVKWLGRFALEGKDMRLADVQLAAAAAFASLRGLRHEKAEKTLLLCTRRPRAYRDYLRPQHGKRAPCRS